MFKNILVPSDGSSLSRSAVEKAVAFAKETGAKITVFHAQPLPPVPYYGVGTGVNWRLPDTYNEQAGRQTQAILDDAASLCHAAGVACQTLSLTSEVPHEAIIAAARQNGCDLIFMASHGRRGISALLLGSETSKVLAHAGIPVLVYR